MSRERKSARESRPDLGVCDIAAFRRDGRSRDVRVARERDIPGSARSLYLSLFLYLERGSDRDTARTVTVESARPIYRSDQVGGMSRSKVGELSKDRVIKRESAEEGKRLRKG